MVLWCFCSLPSFSFTKNTFHLYLDLYFCHFYLIWSLIFYIIFLKKRKARFLESVAFFYFDSQFQLILLLVFQIKKRGESSSAYHSASRFAFHFLQNEEHALLTYLSCSYTQYRRRWWHCFHQISVSSGDSCCGLSLPAPPALEGLGALRILKRGMWTNGGRLGKQGDGSTQTETNVDENRAEQVHVAFINIEEKMAQYIRLYVNGYLAQWAEWGLVLLRKNWWRDRRRRLNPHALLALAEWRKVEREKFERDKQLFLVQENCVNHSFADEEWPSEFSSTMAVWHLGACIALEEEI